jgi:hypothetical protein
MPLLYHPRGGDHIRYITSRDAMWRPPQHTSSTSHATWRPNWLSDLVLGLTFSVERGSSLQRILL